MRIEGRRGSVYQRKAVFFPLLPPSNLTFVKQVRALALDTLLLTGDAFVQDVVRQAGALANNILLANIYPKKGKMLLSRYRALFGEQPIDLAITSCGYEGMRKVINAYAKDNEPSSIYENLFKLFGPTRTTE